MPQLDTSKVSRWDLHGREHIVRVRRTGVQRTIRCDTCGWHRGAQFLPWLKAEEHLADASGGHVTILEIPVAPQP